MTHDLERLVSCALIRDNKTHHQFHTHWELRAMLGDEDPHEPRRSDVYGFWTTEDRFVNRFEAAAIAFKCGQTSHADRALLSSEIDWDGRPRQPATKKPKPLFRM